MSTLVERVNAMTSTLNKAIACGPACEDRRRTEELKRALMVAKRWKEEGPETLYKARKDYLVHTEGVQKYNERMMEIYTAEATQDVGTETRAHGARMKDIVRGIQEVTIGKQTLEGLRRLQKILMTESKELNKAEKDARAKVNTNNARVSLSVGADNTLQTVRTVLMIVYGIAVAAYLWKGPFITGGEYNTIMGWVVASSLIGFGYFSADITTSLMRFYSTILWLLKDNTPRDVYTDLDA